MVDEIEVQYKAVAYYSVKYGKRTTLTFAMQSVRLGGGSLGFALPKILFILSLKSCTAEQEESRKRLKNYVLNQQLRRSGMIYTN